jgi:hypothetical protein
VLQKNIFERPELIAGGVLPHRRQTARHRNPHASETAALGGSLVSRREDYCFTTNGSADPIALRMAETATL